MFNWHKESLKSLLARRDRLPHALLIRGADGTGVPEFAAWLAQSLLCEQPAADGQACGRCQACNWFVQGNHPDLRLVQPESFAVEPEEGVEAPKERKSDQIRIDQVRALQDFLAVGTHRAGARVVVLHPADTMNVATQNALLKNLEEPAPATVFLLVTSRPDRLLPTVRSRCQSVVLPRPGPAEAAAWMKAQGVDDADSLLALAGGAPLAAAELAEGKKLVDLLADRLGERQPDALALAASLQGAPVGEVVTELYRWCYDLLCARLGSAPRYHAGAREEAIGKIAQGCDPVSLSRYLRTLCEARSLAQHPLNARLFVEDLLLQYCSIASQAR